MKAVLVVLSDEVADDVARLFHGCLTMNGYDVQGPPAVIDWPAVNIGDAGAQRSNAEGSGHEVLDDVAGAGT